MKKWIKSNKFISSIIMVTIASITALILTNDETVFDKLDDKYVTGAQMDRFLKVIPNDVDVKVDRSEADKYPTYDVEVPRNRDMYRASLVKDDYTGEVSSVVFTLEIRPVK